MNFCHSDDGDGCGGVFPNKLSPGLCAKCTRLKNLQEGSAEHTMWKAMNQCTGCGVAWKNLDGTICGRCSQPAQQPPGSVGLTADLENIARTAVDTSRVARANAMEARMNKQPAGPALALHTTAGLSTAKTNATPTGENKFFISIECRIKSSSKRDQNATDPDCGRWGKPWSKDDYLSEVLDDALLTLNTHWCKQEGMALVRDEVEFRWAGNKIFLPGTANNTVGEVYKEYLTGEMSLYYSPSESKSKKAAGPKNQFAMALELYVNKPAFVLRRNLTKGIAFDTSAVARKRSATITSIPGADVRLQKRHAGGINAGILQSSFVRTPHVITGVSGSGVSSPVKLMKAHTTCDEETGQVEIVWPDGGDVLSGHLGKEVFATGTTKHVYQLSIGSELFVAKRFFEIGSDAAVTATENEDNLKSELTRLKMVAWFLNKFNAHAKDNRVEVAAGIAVSAGFLIREIGSPSPASALEPFEEDQAVWLIEPRRTKSVQKFSGTLVHPNRHDKVGITLAAFAHFVYEASHKEIVFADIQGSPMNVRGCDTVILFDIMTHSRTFDSGIGDHGPEGINTFVTQHQCNYVCKGLKLTLLVENADPDLASMEADHSENEDNESD